MFNFRSKYFSKPAGHRKKSKLKFSAPLGSVAYLPQKAILLIFRQNYTFNLLFSGENERGNLQKERHQREKRINLRRVGLSCLYYIFIIRALQLMPCCSTTKTDTRHEGPPSYKILEKMSYNPGLLKNS